MYLLVCINLSRHSEKKMRAVFILVAYYAVLLRQSYQRKVRKNETKMNGIQLELFFLKMNAYRILAVSREISSSAISPSSSNSRRHCAIYIEITIC